MVFDWLGKRMVSDGVISLGYRKYVADSRAILWLRVFGFERFAWDDSFDKIRLETASTRIL
jgi:hypothetical protein